MTVSYKHDKFIWMGPDNMQDITDLFIMTFRSCPLLDGDAFLVDDSQFAPEIIEMIASRGMHVADNMPLDELLELPAAYLHNPSECSHKKQYEQLAT